MLEYRQHRLCKGGSDEHDPIWRTPACGRARGQFSYIAGKMPKCQCEPPRELAPKELSESAECQVFCARVHKAFRPISAKCNRLPTQDDYDNPECYPLEKEFYTKFISRDLWACRCNLYF